MVLLLWIKLLAPSKKFKQQQQQRKCNLESSVYVLSFWGLICKEQLGGLESPEDFRVSSSSLGDVHLSGFFWGQVKTSEAADPQIQTHLENLTIDRGGGGGGKLDIHQPLAEAPQKAHSCVFLSFGSLEL